MAGSLHRKDNVTSCKRKVIDIMAAMQKQAPHVLVWCKPVGWVAK
ncbi:signal recognition particle-docking protein FtsY [Acetobacter orientalis]|uniref:Signal recognition particle-docking protein FtsY n=1 Tax=Acetobacter orientalis TaxID=146474 RepID=A0A2Z5ZFZ7_9PROT|nr:signal recognition particle-docking protein FtsY [Acetobacter orientalis]